MKGVSMEAFCLCEFVELPLETPQCQRALGVDRVDAIVEFQRNHYSKYATLNFLGCITICIDHNGKMWLVDGQHRASAFHQLHPLQPDYEIYINMVKLVETSLSIQEVFLQVNLAVPVPDYVVDSIVDQHRRQFLETVNDKLKKLFKPFDSSAMTPRRPNLRLDTLTQVVCEPRVLKELNHNPEDVIKFVLWVNNQMQKHDEQVTDSAKKKAEKFGSNTYVPCFISAHPDWVIEENWYVWCTSFYKSRTDLPAYSNGRKTSQKKKAIPKGIRNMLWDSLFKGCDGGHCQVCSCDLRERDYEAGHIVAESKGGLTQIPNLVPVCHQCNLDMGTTDMQEYCMKIGVEPYTPFETLRKRQDFLPTSKLTSI